MHGFGLMAAPSPCVSYSAHARANFGLEPLPGLCLQATGTEADYTVGGKKQEKKILANILFPLILLAVLQGTCDGHHER